MTQSTNFVLALESLLVFLCACQSTTDNANQQSVFISYYVAIFRTCWQSVTATDRTVNDKCLIFTCFYQYFGSADKVELTQFYWFMATLMNNVMMVSKLQKVHLYHGHSRTSRVLKMTHFEHQNISVKLSKNVPLLYVQYFEYSIRLNRPRGIRI